jgi:surfactin synthase thioesterase subunit
MSEQWFSLAVPQQAAPHIPLQGLVRLFCFPYAGAAHTAYHAWHHDLLKEVDLALVKLPGRGMRLGEPHAASFGSLTDEISDAIAKSLSGTKSQRFALFGHSMGALLAFETARRLHAKHRIVPESLFVSGCASPSVPRKQTLTNLSDDAFIEAIAAMNGMPEDICREPELVAFFLPILRADIALCEAYRYRPSPPLPCPVTIFAGDGDNHVPLCDLDDWAQETSSGCQKFLYPGGHFFLFQHQAAILRILRAGLNSPAEPPYAIA